MLTAIISIGILPALALVAFIVVTKRREVMAIERSPEGRALDFTRIEAAR